MSDVILHPQVAILMHLAWSCLEVEFGELEFGLEVEFDKLDFQAGPSRMYQYCLEVEFVKLNFQPKLDFQKQFN